MVYAGDILSDCFKMTKELFFPIRKEYWLKMGFVSLFGGNNNGGGSGGGNSLGNFGNSDTGNAVAGMTFKQAVSQLNTQALEFLSKYGYIVGIAIFSLYLLSLFFTYLSSVFTFVFIDGIIKKEIKIKKSFSENKPQGISYFFFRFYLGLITIAALLLILSPLGYSFFTNTLSEFNLWLLIPMGFGFFIFFTLLGIFIFLVNNFVIPLMYLKKYSFGQAWAYFKKIVSGKKFEIFMFWLIKIGLSIVGGIGLILLLLPLFIIGLFLVLIGVGIFLGINLLGGELAAVIVTGIYAGLIIMLFIYALAVVSVPIPAFFIVYSIEMIKKLEESKTAKPEPKEEEKPEKRAAEKKK